MRRDPTIKLVRLACIAPAMMTTWAVEADSDVPDEVTKLVEEDFITGTAIEKTHTLTIPEAWDANNMSVIVFVHNSDADSREVLQAAEVHL